MFEKKISFEDFQEFYIQHPGLSQYELADLLGVSRKTISNKINLFNRLNNKFFDPNIAQLCKEAYKEGLREGEEKGFIMGAGLGVGIGEILKQNGIGISDFIQSIGKIKKG